MRRLFALLLVFTSLNALAQSPVIRAHLEPSNNVMVGQPVRLVVSIFVPNYFTGSPEFPEFEIDNAIVVLPQDRPQNSNTQIGNATYFGITQTYVIYPQQAGDFHIPPAKFSVPYAIAPPKSTTAEIALPALSFHAGVPAAARDLSYFLPTTRLTMTERWSRSLKDLRTGDTVERTVIITASKMQAMLIPPLTFEQPDGIRIYNGEPTVRDQKTDRGDFVYGQRVQTAKYFIVKSGDYTLPPLELKWWNLLKHQMATSSLNAVHFSAIDNPEFTVEVPPVEPTSSPAPKKTTHGNHYRSIVKTNAIGVIFAVAIVLFAWLSKHVYRKTAVYLESYKASESACFRKLIHYAKAHDVKLTYKQLMRWANHIFPGMPLGEIVRDRARSDLRYQVETLATIVYSVETAGTGEWNSDELVLQLKEFRRQIHKRRSLKTRHQGLSTLNPSEEE
jgi:oxygen tolerance protein BatD